MRESVECRPANLQRCTYSKEDNYKTIESECYVWSDLHFSFHLLCNAVTPDQEGNDPKEVT